VGHVLGGDVTSTSQTSLRGFAPSSNEEAGEAMDVGEGERPEGGQPPHARGGMGVREPGTFDNLDLDALQDELPLVAPGQENGGGPADMQGVVQAQGVPPAGLSAPAPATTHSLLSGTTNTSEAEREGEGEGKKGCLIC
jgi:hypothetical protein